MLDEREGDVAEEDAPKAFNRQSPWKRIAIVAAGPLINLVFAIFCFGFCFYLQEQLNTRVGKCYLIHLQHKFKCKWAIKLPLLMA